METYNLKPISIVPSKEILSNISIFTAIFLMLSTSGVWLFWEFKLSSYIYILFIILRSLILLKTKKMSRISTSCLIFWSLFLIWFGIIKSDSINVMVRQSVVIISLMFVVLMTFKEKIRLAILAINVYSVILSISILTYLLYLIGFNLPHTFIYPQDREDIYICYYGFVMITGLNSLRFCSVFMEPGQCGMICALLLFFNQFNFKNWKSYPLLIGTILSFSMSGYLLLILGYIIFNISERKGLKQILIFSLVLIFSLFLINKFINTQQNEGIVNELIFERMELDENRGIKGNNRTTKEFNIFYEKLSGINYVIGLASTNNLRYENLMKKFGNNSYRVTIMGYGLIGLLLLIGFFYTVVLQTPSRLGYGMFLLFTISYLQRIYWLWPIESYLYICFASIFFQLQNLKINNLNTTLTSKHEFI